MNNGLEHPGVLDALAFDPETDRLILAMYETREWTGGDSQLFQLQEKLNAYLSFALDGELKEAFPQFAEKRVQIQLRTIHLPDERGADLMQRMREQLAFQQIEFAVVQVGEDESGGGCGHGGCGCGH
jgi:hypothetical protein